MVVNTDEVLMKDSIRHAQSNTAMWLGGSIEVRGKLLSNNTTIATRELIDNALQEVGEHCPKEALVSVFIDGENCTVKVTDNGRGLPIAEKLGRNGINLTLGTIMASTNYEDKKIGRTSLNGVGASVTNAISKSFKVRSSTQQGIFEMHYVDGYPVNLDGEYFLKPGSDPEHFTTDHVDYKPYTLTEPRVKGAQTGTTVTATFANPEIIVLDRLRASLEGAAKLNPALTITLNVTPGQYVDIDKPLVEQIHFDGGFDALIAELGSPENVQTIKIKSQPEALNEFVMKAHVSILSEADYMKKKEVVQKVFVNKIAVDSANFEYLISNWATRFMKNDDGVFSHLVEYIVAFDVMTPSFTSQSKHQYSDIKINSPIWASLSKIQNRLGTAENSSFLSRYLKSLDIAKKSLEEQKITKEAKGKSTAIPGFYSSRMNKELYLCEGTSAIGSIIKTRDSETQSAIAFRGTPLNIIANEKHIKVNQEIQALIRIFGGYKSAFHLENCTYEKIIIAADADIDGRCHIAPMMIMIFHKLFPGLIEDGRVYIADSPLYKHKDGSFSFMDDEVDMSTVVERYKGLGSMRPEVLKSAIVDPSTRKLIQVQLEPSEKIELDHVLNNWFNPLAGHVKQLIHAKFGISID